jgi:hypothetical protein
MKPNLGQRGAVEIARDAGAKEPREKIRDLLKLSEAQANRAQKDREKIVPRLPRNAAQLRISTSGFFGT